MNRDVFVGLLSLVTVVLASGAALAHEVRPGYLELREIAPATFSVLWKVPMKGGARLGLEPGFPGSCHRQTQPSPAVAAGAMIERWSLTCDGGLSGGAISIAGLEHTLTDVLVRVERLDRSALTARVTPANPSFAVAPSAG